MINGYRYITRESPEHEPIIVGTRLTVTWIIRDLEGGEALSEIESILEDWQGRVTREMINEALDYYKVHKLEIDGYISESIKRSGTVFKTR